MRLPSPLGLGLALVLAAVTAAADDVATSTVTIDAAGSVRWSLEQVSHWTAAAAVFGGPGGAFNSRACMWLAQAGTSSGGAFVQQGFLGQSDRIALLSRLPEQGDDDDARRSHLAVPGWLADSLVAALSNGTSTGTSRSRSASGAEVMVPTYEMAGDHPEHQDRVVAGPDRGALARGRVGLVYLEGDGDFVLKDTATGAEQRVPIEPGTFVSWPNARFSHRVEGASPSVWRRMLGPMAVDAASNALVAVGTFSTLCAQGLGCDNCTAGVSIYGGSQGARQCSFYCGDFYPSNSTHFNWLPQQVRLGFYLALVGGC